MPGTTRAAETMRLRLILLAAALCLAAPARAFLWFRQTFPSRWAVAPVSMSGDDPAWYSVDATEKAGLDLRAMNDATNLYLRVAADDDVGRALLTGTYRQDMTIWFMGRDLKTHAWGLSFPFSRIPAPKNMTFDVPHFTKTKNLSKNDGEGGSASASEIEAAPPPPPPAPSDPDPLDQGLDVLLLLDQGGVVSTIPFAGSGVQFQSFGDHRHPVYQLLIPLVQLPVDAGKTIPFDIVTGHCSPDVQRQYYAYQGRMQSGVRLIAATQAATMNVSSAPVSVSSSPSTDSVAAAPTPTPSSGVQPLQNGLPSALIPTAQPAGTGTSAAGLTAGVAMASPGAGASAGQGSTGSSSFQDATSFYDFTLPSAETIRLAVRLAKAPRPRR